MRVNDSYLGQDNGIYAETALMSNLIVLIIQMGNGYIMGRLNNTVVEQNIIFHHSMSRKFRHNMQR